MSFSSCTITQRRYRSGFHLEWKHRFKPQKSLQKSDLKNITIIVESANADSSEYEIASIRSAESFNVVPVKINKETENNLHSKSELTLLPIKLNKLDLVNSNYRAIHHVDPDKNEKKRSGFVEFILSFFMTLLVFAIPPILFTSVADYLSFSKFKIGLLWFIWIAGIVGSILLFQVLWPIIFACIIWNILYLFGGIIIIFITA